MLHIIIPVFNRKHFTKDCLISLREQTYQHFKVVVVDDGSTDGTYEMVKNDFPEVDILRQEGDLFWTAATNIGIRYALAQGADAVMTLNNDTVALKDFLEKMSYWAQKEPDALLGAFALDFSSQKPVYGGGIINWKTDTRQDLLKSLQPKDYKGLHKVTHFPGRGLWIPRKVLEKIGLFDEKVFPHYYADYDYTHLAYRSGFKIYCNYDAKLYTYPEASGDRQNRKQKSLKSYFNHLFGIKGGGNLRNFTIYAFRNCPPIYMPGFLAIGYSKRIFGYLLK